MAPLNYATEYSQALAQAFPYTLHFGALYATPNNGRYRWVNARTIEIPSLKTTGRVDSNRDTIATATRNFDNSWEPKTLVNQRKWSTLVHPMDIVQTNMVATIQNITMVYNEEQKFPEMDAYLLSKLYSEWTALGKVANTTVLTSANVLDVFDTMMLAMDNARVSPNGRILYVTHEVNKMLKNAQTADGSVSRNIDVNMNNGVVDRNVSRLDQVTVVPVPAELMKSLYDFTVGWTPDPSATQINMFLVQPIAVITPVSYQFAQLDPPAAMTEGKYVYFEESFEDAFILNNRADALQFNVSP